MKGVKAKENNRQKNERNESEVRKAIELEEKQRIRSKNEREIK